MGKEQAERHVEMPPLKLCRSGAMPRIQRAALPPPSAANCFPYQLEQQVPGGNRNVQICSVYFEKCLARNFDPLFSPYKEAWGNFFVLQPGEGDIRGILFAPGTQIIINMLSSASSTTRGTGARAINITMSLQGRGERQSLHREKDPGFYRVGRTA